MRGDRLVLAKPMHPGDKGNPNADTTARRLLENFADIAASFHVHASKLQLGGPLEEEGVRVAEAEKVRAVPLIGGIVGWGAPGRGGTKGQPGR